MTTLLTFAENENRDLFLGPDGNLAMTSQIDATALLCKSRIEAQRNEMIYAMNEGMPTRDTAWDRFNPNAFVAAARTILLATPGVVRVISFVLQHVENDLSYTAVILTDYGITTITGTLQ